MELDIYIPSLHLGFEYQGSQHFDDKFHLFDSKLHERYEISLFLFKFVGTKKREKS